MDHVEEATEDTTDEKTKGFFHWKFSFWQYLETNKENVQSNSQPMVDDEEK